MQDWLDGNLDLFWSKEFSGVLILLIVILSTAMGGASLRQSNKCVRNDGASLGAAIVESVARTDKQHLVEACNCFRHRIQAVIEAGGGWIEEWGSLRMSLSYSTLIFLPLVLCRKQH